MSPFGKLPQTYDRRVDERLLAALQGPLSSLLTYRAQDPALRDLQLRRQPWGSTCWASLYLGLTSVLDVVLDAQGRFRLEAHATHRKRGHLDPALGEPQTLQELVQLWPAAEDYLARIQDRVDDKWVDAEGRVHAQVANAAATGFHVINREASHAFRDTLTKQERLDAWSAPLRQALLGTGTDDAWWTNVVDVPFGLSPDFIAVDDQGRLLVVEAKPASATAGIVRGPVQVACYAAMWAAWLEETPDARERLHEELAQRHALGLLPGGLPGLLADPVPVVPTLLVGPGQVSSTAWQRMRTVASTVASVHPHLAPLEVLVLDSTGRTASWDWSADAPLPHTEPEPVEAVPYRHRARAAAARWRDEVLELPHVGPFGAHLLPEEHAQQNLLPEAAGAVALFAERGVPWHQPVGDGPSRNLVSSQVQCVNALFLAVEEPSRLERAFAGALGPITVVPFDATGAHVVFEHAGPAGLLGEGSGVGQTRVDAAFRYRAADGSSCLALIEWKYTEHYFSTTPSTSELYRDLWLDPVGPLRSLEVGDGPLTYEQVLVEPFYQRVRQQLLAWRLEQTTDPDRVVVVHVSPSQNLAYQESLPLSAHKGAGSTVEQVWQQVLRVPDRFRTVDASVFLDPSVTSADYAARYGHA